MRRLIQTVCHILFGLSLLFSGSPQVYANGKYITLTFAEWKPMGQMDETGECLGLLPDISRAVFEEELGFRLICQERPWKRAQLEVELGASDFMITVPTESRKVYALVSQSVFYTLPLYIYTYGGHDKLKEINKIRSAADIKALNLVPVTNLGNGWHKDNVDVHGINTHYVGKEINILRFLATKRADIMIDAVTPTNYLIRQNGLTHKIVLTKSRFSQVNFHLLLSKKSKFAQWMPEIDAAFRRASAKGHIKAIVDRYERLEP
ncbi:MAG: transporter substrate-binding domain-containing protein [Desulfobacterales bacterium]|nr:transporter substrate-binding domain-containing protein [Desulfobacterales bacterium]